MSEYITIPGRCGDAAIVRAGERIKIVNITGEQVVDTWAFNQRNPQPRIAQGKCQAGAGKAVVHNDQIKLLHVGNYAGSGNGYKQNRRDCRHRPMAACSGAAGDYCWYAADASSVADHHRHHPACRAAPRGQPACPTPGHAPAGRRSPRAHSPPAHYLAYNCQLSIVFYLVFLNEDK